MSVETQPRDDVGRWRARWRHNWQPLNWAAALLKAHHNRAQARRLLEGARHPGHPLLPALGQTSPKDQPSSSADRGQHSPAEAAGTTASRRKAALRDLDDTALTAAMVDADEADLDRIVAELGRRDRNQRAAEKRAAKRSLAERNRDTEYGAFLDAGRDPEEAFEAVYGVTVKRQRQQAAVASMKAAGYPGRSFVELCRSAFREHVELAYVAAENATRGHMLNAAGQRRRINPRSLMIGPESRARKYASEELLSHWQAKGRLTLDDFTASALGEKGRSLSTDYFA